MWLETAPLITMPDTRTTAPQTVSVVMGRAAPAVWIVAGSVARCGSKRGKRAWRSLNKPRFGGVFSSGDRVD
jgi:hypothetical protein